MYLVVGANGFLGAYFLKNLLQMTNEQILATARSIEKPCIQDDRIIWRALDIEDWAAVDRLADGLSSQTPLNVVFLAAYHHPDQVEAHPRKAWNVNVTSLAYFLNAMPDMAYFLYPSTDTVYGEGGANLRFSEDSPLHPVNRYGRQKVVAESIVTGYDHHVVRYPFLIGPSLVPGRPHFYDRILEHLRHGEPVEMFEDSYRSTLSFDAVANLSLRLMALGSDCVPPVVNVAGDEALSKYDVGRRIAQAHGFDMSLVHPISVKHAQGIFGVPRASSAILDNQRLKKLLGLKSIRLRIGEEDADAVD